MAHWFRRQERPRWKIVEENCLDLRFVNDNDDLVQKFHESRDPIYWHQMIVRYKTEVRVCMPRVASVQPEPCHLVARRLDLF